MNPTLIHDLAEACSHFATAAVNSLPTATQLTIADKIAEGATFAVRVQLTPFRASVDLLAPTGEAVANRGAFTPRHLGTCSAVLSSQQ